MTVAGFILVLWMSGSGKAIATMPGLYPSNEECLAYAKQYVPQHTQLDYFCLPVPQTK